MTPTKAERLKALDDLEHVYRVVFEDLAPLDEDADRIMRRALSVLHAAEREMAHPFGGERA